VVGAVHARIPPPEATDVSQAQPSRRDSSQARSSPDAGVLFARYDCQLRDRVRGVVNTSEANIEDACMFAWVQLLRYELDEAEAAYSWLSTVAVREAVKLDRG